MLLRHWAAVAKDGSYIKNVTLAESQEQAEILLFSNCTEEFKSLFEVLPVKVTVDTEITYINSLASKSYNELFVDDFVSNGKIAKVLNSNGLCYKTVCPDCYVDDFSHVRNCTKFKLIEHI